MRTAPPDRGLGPCDASAAGPPRSRLRQRIAAALFLASLLLSAIRLHDLAPRIDEVAAIATYARVEAWLDAARCTLSRGVLLAICEPGGGIVPIEKVSPADDPGHALLVAALATLTRSEIDRRQLVWLHVAINLVSVWILAAAFLAFTRFRAVPAALLLAGPHLAVPGPLPTPDAFASFFGAYGLALLPLLWIAGAPWPASPWHRFALGLLGVSLAGVAATLLRQPIGLIGLAGAGLALAFRLLAPPGSVSRPTVVRRGLLVAVVVFSLQLTANDGLLALRTHVFGVPAGPNRLVHGLSHNLYIGLGAGPNPFGIRWDDLAGFRAVQAVDPEVPYGSARHFDVLFDLWLGLVLSHPVEVLRIYARKSLETAVIVTGGGFFWPVSFVVGLLGACVWLRPRPDPASLACVLLLAATAAGLALQGVLAMPMAMAVTPAAAAFQLAGVAAAELVWRSRAERGSDP